MKLFNDERITEFWISIMDKLSNEEDNINVALEVLIDLCNFFDFEFSFIYHSNHEGILSLDNSFKIETSDTIAPKEINLREKLGDDFFGVLKRSKMVYVRANEKKTELEEKMTEIFNTESILVLPILNESRELIGMIGMGDRRSERRHGELNRQLVYSVLVLIANNVKLLISMKTAEQTESALNKISNNMGVDIYVNDFKTHEILYVNKSRAEPYGGVESMMGKICFEALYDDKKSQCDFCPQSRILDENNEPTKVYSWDYMRPFDASWFRVLSAAFKWDGSRMAHIVSSIDITDHKRIEESISKIANYDNLTGLKSRHKLNVDLGKKIECGESVFLLFFDLNKFKLINDQYGHRIGDELLKIIGSFLANNEMVGEYTYRYGDDEFVILVDSSSKNQAVKVAKAIEKRSRSPWGFEGKELKCSVSIGIAQYPEDSDNALELLRKAEKAMYEAKTNEYGITFYNQGNIKAIDWVTRIFS
ncbi:MAG: diguanylate cyclase domain-containing protein [Suipraeoptans sp.]